MAEAVADRARSRTELLSASLCTADAGAVALRPGDGRRPHPRRQHGGNRATHPRRRAAAFRARGAFDGRLHRAGNRAPGSGTRREARLARYRSRADTPEATAKRHTNIALAQSGRFDDVIDPQFPLYVHPDRVGDTALKADYLAMCHDVGPEAYVRQQQAIMTRVDSRPLLPSIDCPTLVLVGAEDAATPPELSEEMAAGIPGATLVKVPGLRSPLHDGAPGGCDQGARGMDEPVTTLRLRRARAMR